MKAKEYAKAYTGVEPLEAMNAVCLKLFDEANALARLRNCHGGPGTDTSFGTYADCFKEQWVKWLAICRLLPDFIPSRFVVMLLEEHPLVFKMLNLRREFQMVIGNDHPIHQKCY